MAIAAGEGSVWVFNTLGGSVTRIDATTGKVLSTSPRVVGRAAGNPDYAGLAVGDGSVWVLSPTEGTVVRLDVESNRPQGKPIEVGTGPTGISHRRGRRSGSPTPTHGTDHPDRLAHRPDRRGADRRRGPARGGGGRCPALSGSRIGRGRSRGSTPSRTALVGEPIPVEGSPLSLAVGDGAVWVANPFNSTVARIGT